MSQQSCKTCGKYLDDDAVAEELRVARETIAALCAERNEIFWVMFRATERKMPVEYRERRWKESIKWVDCGGPPCWNWHDYIYRIKEDQGYDSPKPRPSN